MFCCSFAIRIKNIFRSEIRLKNFYVLWGFGGLPPKKRVRDSSRQAKTQSRRAGRFDGK